MHSSRPRSCVALSISMVSELADIEVHTLRYWEREFTAYLRPQRTKGGQRRYSAEDVSRVLEIKRLLKQEMYSIAGAKRALECGER